MIRAVLGGSFDPVHDGHVAMADYLLANRVADQVRIVPAARSPFKSGHVADRQQRLAMLHLAFAEHQGLVIDTGEFARPGPSWTVNTLEDLHEAHPDDSLLLVLGEDNLPGLPRWRDIGRILELARIFVFPRGGLASARQIAADLAEAGWPGARVTVATGFRVPVSSRELRAMLGRSETIGRLVPTAVADYIASQGLYTA